MSSAFGKVIDLGTTPDGDSSAVVQGLGKLGRRGRRAAFAAACPGLGGQLASVYENAERLTYQSAWDRRPFRAPSAPQLARQRVIDQSPWTLPELAALAADPPWLARWAGHLLAQSWSASPHLIGWLLAAGVDEGDDEVLELLLASTDGSDDFAVMGRHVPIALLCAGREEGWERVEGLLLAAQRQEGLRQSILEVVDEARPEAFRRMLALILEQGLSRFASVARAVSVWLGLEVLAGERGRIDSLIVRALELLADPASQETTARGGDPLDTYLALWASAVEDVHVGIDRAGATLDSPDPERRFAGAYFLAQSRLTTAGPALRKVLADDDVRVAALAVAGLSPLPANTIPESYDAFDALLERIPKRAVTLEPISWLGPLPALKREEIGGLLLRHSWPPDVDRLLPHVALLAPSERGALVDELARHGDDETRRAALIDLLGDTSAAVRERAIKVCSRLELRDEEALELEDLLRRKPGDLRRGVLELITARGAGWALGAAERLLSSEHPQQRLGGVDLLRRLTDDEDFEVAQRARSELARLDDEDRVVGEATERALGDEGLTGLTESDGFGLFAPDDLTKVIEPRRTGFEHTTRASRRVLASLDALVAGHADCEVRVIHVWEEPEPVLLGALHWADLLGHHQRFQRGETDVPVPLLELWTTWVRELAPAERDGDDLQLLRALLRCEKTALRDRWGLGGEGNAGLRYFHVVRAVLELLVWLEADEKLLAGALDAAEDGLARLGRRELQARTGSDPVRGDGAPAALRLVRELVEQPFAASHLELLRRHWGLERWLSEPAGVDPLPSSRHVRRSDRQPMRPPLTTVVRAWELGAASRADLVDHLVGPRGPHWSFFDLGEASSLCGRRAGQRTGEVVEEIRERIVAMELARGEEPTQAAAAACSLRTSGGLEVFLGALRALGREKLVRGWASDGEGRASVLSHLVATSEPRRDEPPARLAAAVHDEKLSSRRLREAGCYAPQWADHVQEALRAPGLADAVWWLHAHTKDDRWRAELDRKAGWQRAVAERTELSAAELIDGAVDVAWFTEVRERLGDSELDQLLGAARYGSTSGGHKRAELFARAMRGDVTEDELLARMEEKRHQDSVRALGLLPLPAEPEARADALARRYGALHGFRRASRRFGQQRQASEARATAIGMDNLARTAGFRDPVRLTWAMEAAATQDLRDDGVSVTAENVTVTLRVDAAGRPDVAVRRGDRTLKAVPAKLRKNATIKELTGRATELRRQAARVRTALEQAMVRGDELTGDELVRYREHVLLWPALSRLVLVGDGICGYPARDGRVLLDFAGSEHVVGREETVRIAHPRDLLDRNDWPAWQRHAMRERVVQPCKQLFRELYVPVGAEVTDHGGSRRYAGHQIQPGRARALLTGCGWTFDEFEGVRRIDHREHIAASVWFLNGFGSPADVEPPTLEEVRFEDTRDGRRVELDQVPARLFSEVMRDLDLVVSVAHVAGVDPEASQSSIAARAALVTETCQLLRRENVTVVGPRAVIQGQIARYAVHLGSAVVHRLPGGSVCIVPVHAQQRGRVFLPFADDDPKTAEILAKVLMLARDDEIRDPTILEQLRA